MHAGRPTKHVAAPATAKAIRRDARVTATDVRTAQRVIKKLGLGRKIDRISANSGKRVVKVATVARIASQTRRSGGKRSQ